jgi:hypothetical protein
MLRKSHPHEIYIILVPLLSLFFVLFFFVFVLAEERHVFPEELLGESWRPFLAALLKDLRDGEAEVKMVLALVSLAILPRWLTYILSGLSGSASPPLFISQ